MDYNDERRVYADLVEKREKRLLEFIEGIAYFKKDSLRIDSLESCLLISSPEEFKSIYQEIKSNLDQKKETSGFLYLTMVRHTTGFLFFNMKIPTEPDGLYWVVRLNTDKTKEFLRKYQTEFEIRQL